MNKSLLVFAILVFLFSCSRNKTIENCDFLTVDAKVIYNVLNRNPIPDYTVYESRSLDDLIIGKDTFNVLMVNPDLNILSYYRRGFIENKPTREQRDYLTIKEKKILIDSLFFGNRLPDDYWFMTYFYKSYIFDFNNKKFCALFSENTFANTTLPNTILLLLDITRMDDIKILLSEYQACGDINCFGDINQDNELDYIQWSQGMEFADTVYIYSLNNKTNIFEKNKNVFVKVLESETWGYCKIDVTKSEYFYKILCK